MTTLRRKKSPPANFFTTRQGYQKRLLILKLQITLNSTRVPIEIPWKWFQDCVDWYNESYPFHLSSSYLEKQVLGSVVDVAQYSNWWQKTFLPWPDGLFSSSEVFDGPGSSSAQWNSPRPSSSSSWADILEFLNEFKSGWRSSDISGSYLATADGSSTFISTALVRLVMCFRGGGGGGSATGKSFSSQEYSSLVSNDEDKLSLLFFFLPLPLSLPIKPWIPSDLAVLRNELSWSSLIWTSPWETKIE